MTSIRDSIRRRLTPVEPLPPGLYQYKAPVDAPIHYRLHLRLEAGGHGVLLVNASTILHLNPTAAEYAYHLIQGHAESQVVSEIVGRYKVSPQQALADYRSFVERLDVLIATPDLDPVSFLDFDRHEIYSGELSAPYRLDCALTYQLRAGTEMDSAPAKRVDRELSTDEWKRVMDKSWMVGIPHMIFTGGEPTLRSDLPELLNHAEKIGQITGLLTDGLRLQDSAYLDRLILAGLDHVMVVLQPQRDQTWESLAGIQYWSNVLAADLFVAAHLTITHENVAQANQILDRLAELEIHAVSLSANDPSLAPALPQARDYVADLDMALVWDLPVPYSSLNPISLETQMESTPEGAGRAWLYVEPDGDVLPSQGVNEVLGNILTDEWEEIWKPG